MPLRRLSMIAALGALSAVASARADGPAAVQDDAHLFSEEAVRQANDKLLDFEDDYGVAFIIRTVQQPPADVQKELATARNAAAKDKILHDWAQKEADGAGKAVYILVCKDAVHGWFGRVYGCVLITVPEGLRSDKFTANDARLLQYRLRWFTRSGDKAKNDAILRAAVAQVGDDLSYNHLPPFPWVMVGGVMAGVLGLWGMLGLVRMRLQARDPLSAPEPQRRSLFAALLGGMFGSPAGHWIYDSLFVAASTDPATPPAVTPPPVEEKREAIQTEPAEPPPLTKAERLDLAAHDHSTEEAPTAPGPTPF
ncbi:MAG TPA: hypothetical protein VMS17_01975 [Gemmataceae bacterium]|nr:hypothetical protein [Gemmataceae bacterium]